MKAPLRRLALSVLVWWCNARTITSIRYGGGQQLSRSSTLNLRLNQTQLQAEKFDKLVGCQYATKYNGFGGSGYLNCDAIESFYFQRSNVIIDEDGDYLFLFRYSANGRKDCSINLYVQGESLKEISFPRTGGWDVWRNTTVVVPLKQGIADIQVQSKSGSSGLNLDFISLEIMTVNTTPKLQVDVSVEPARKLASRRPANNETTHDVIILEAEHYTKSHDCTNEAKHSGYSGRGYMDYEGGGSYVEWEVDIQTPGNHLLTFRYALFDQKARPCLLSIDGMVFGELSFVSTNGWNLWKFDSITLPLEQKRVTLRLASIGDGPNLDVLFVEPAKEGQNSTNRVARNLLSGTSFGVPAVGIHEAEDATTNNNCTQQTHPGIVSGAGYMNCTTSRSSLEWMDLYVVDPGMYILKFRYAAINPDGRPSSVSVQDKEVGQLSFEETDGWANFRNESIVVRLERGRNKISISALNEGPMLDYMAIEHDVGPRIDFWTSPSCDGAYQAERYSEQSGCSVDKEHNGFAGTGYINCGDADSWLQWNEVNFPASGEYLISFRYAVNDENGRPSHLFVGGISFGEVAFGDTGGWDDWGLETISAQVSEGKKPIKVTFSGKAPNLDFLFVRPARIKAPANGTITYTPGCLMERIDDLRLSRGLQATKIATTNEYVQYANGSQSENAFHVRPDGADVFVHKDGKKWAYVTNSEDRTHGKGSVGSIVFDADGRVIQYQKLLEHTTSNCGGGKTPWGTWLSCEEHTNGAIYEVEPFGEPIFNGSTWQKTTLSAGTQHGARYEAVACDNRDPSNVTFYYTADEKYGELTQFRPNNAVLNQAIQNGDFRRVLSTNGTSAYLVLKPETKFTGTYYWSDKRDEGRESAVEHFQYSEGIEFDALSGILYFVSKKNVMLFSIYLNSNRYEKIPLSNILDDHADQLRLLRSGDDDHMLYFAEDGGRRGVYARDQYGNFLSILAGYGGQATGIAFSPDKRHMYVAFQGTGDVWDITREDGFAFTDAALCDPFCAAKDG